MQRTIRSARVLLTLLLALWGGSAAAATAAQQDGGPDHYVVMAAHIFAPFDAAAVHAVLPCLDFLILNAVEAGQLQAATGMHPSALPVRHVIVTRGARGVRHFDTNSGESRDFPAIPVTAVDTTGAGDTFAGYVLAGLDRGMPMAQAIGLALRAAAIMVTRHGTADVIPDLKDVSDAR